MRIFTGVVIAAAVAGLILRPGGPSADAAAHQGTWLITTAAGGVGGPGPARKVDVQACAVTASGGALYAVDRALGSAPVIRRIDQRTGTLTTVVGDGGLGSSPNGTRGTVTNLSNGCGLAIDRAGNLLFSQDYYGGTFPANMFAAQRVKVLAAHSGRFYGQIMKAGDVYTIAGNGQSGERGDGGPALRAEMNTPGGLAVDSAGNVLVEDTFYDRIRLVAERTGTFYGRSMKAGDIYTIAGNGGIFYTGDGVPATTSAIGLRAIPLFETGQGISLDRAGNLVIADNRNNRVRVVAVKSGPFYGQSMKAGDIYTIAGNGSAQSTGNGGPATSAGVNVPVAVTVDSAGNVLVSQQGQCQARVVAASSGQFYGQTMTAGDIYAIGGGAACASIGVAVDSAGNVVTAGGSWLGVVAGATGDFYGKPMIVGGQYAVTSTRPASEIGNAEPATRVELSPAAIALDPAGDLLISEGTELRLVAKHTGTVYGRSVRIGHIYTIATGLKLNYVGSPVPGLTTDKFGNVLTASATGVYLIAARDGRFYGKGRQAGHVYTIVGGGNSSNLSGVPANDVSIDTSGIAVDRAGNIVIGDWFNVPLVEVVAARTGTYYGMPMRAGYIYTVAGTGGTSGFEGNGVPGTESVIDPLGLATDRAGNIVVTDFNNDTVRILAARSGPDFGQHMMPGYIYGLAGNGTGFGGDGGPAASAKLNGAEGVGVDAAGNVLIADQFNCRVRAVAARSGPFYGRAMKADHIYTIAGSGCLPNQMSPLLPKQHVGSGKFGDGIPATSAELFSPTAVAGAAAGGVYVADGYRVRVIQGVIAP